MLASSDMVAAVIPLACWQDPQGALVLIYSERECSIFFGCWVSPGEPADYIGHLSFKSAAAVRSYGREFSPYQVPAPSARSYILCVEDSDFLREQVAYQRQHYPQLTRASLQHLVVVGHDIYHEVLAAGFTETTIPVTDLTDERLLVLYRSA